MYENNKFHHKGFSVFSAGKETSGYITKEQLPLSPIINAWLEDDDIQEITITSTNIGFSRTFTKIFKETINAK